MNVFIPDGCIDQFILEDMPYIDLTTEVLGIGEEPGEIEYFTREDCVLTGVEEAARVLGRTGARVIWSRRSGERLAAGEPFLRAEGTAAALHMALTRQISWRIWGLARAKSGNVLRAE